MTFAFNSERGLIVVPVELLGPSGSMVLRLALDTGATATMINVSLLATAGYDPALAPERVTVTTGSGVEYVPRLTVVRLNALGETRADFPVLAHTLPPSATIDGLLSLDFFRGHLLTIDFREGRIIHS